MVVQYLTFALYYIFGIDEKYDLKKLAKNVNRRKLKF